MTNINNAKKVNQKELTKSQKTVNATVIKKETQNHINKNFANDIIYFLYYKLFMVNCYRQLIDE